MKRLTPGKLALAAGIFTFLLASLLFLLMPGLSDLFWLSLDSYSPVLPCLLLALLAGLFCWIRALAIAYGEKLDELEEKLENMKKD